jgi:hypothetical protein
VVQVFSIDNLHVRLIFDLGKKQPDTQGFHFRYPPKPGGAEVKTMNIRLGKKVYSYQELIKISKTAKFGYEML